MSLDQHICYTIIKPEQTVPCSITVLIQTVYWLLYGRMCVSVILSALLTAHSVITVYTVLVCCWHEDGKLHYACWCSRLLHVYLYFLPRVSSTCKWRSWTGLYWRTRNVGAIRLRVNYIYLQGRAENERADHVVALELTIPVRGCWYRV